MSTLFLIFQLKLSSLTFKKSYPKSYLDKIGIKYSWLARNRICERMMPDEIEVITLTELAAA